ncbi:hypothetical protein M9Y10_017908 [Tritrichomonas musculus]|uniref:Uncharacterized protein n=1 Tax=Tritrichomonas musculus TaxID=1915356 RepID=A0ABR2HUS7_9EUKA
MSTKVVKFDDSNTANQENRQHTPHQKKYRKPRQDNQPNIISQFFSKGWNIIRLFFFLIVIIFITLVLFSTFSSIPEGGSFTWLLFISQLRESLGIIGYSSPFLDPIFEKLSKVLTEENFKFLFFLSSVFLTIGMLVCFCP